MTPVKTCLQFFYVCMQKQFSFIVRIKPPSPELMPQRIQTIFHMSKTPGPGHLTSGKFVKRKEFTKTNCCAPTPQHGNIWTPQISTEKQTQTNFRMPATPGKFLWNRGKYLKRKDSTETENHALTPENGSTELYKETRSCNPRKNFKHKGVFSIFACSLEGNKNSKLQYSHTKRACTPWNQLYSFSGGSVRFRTVNLLPINGGFAQSVLGSTPPRLPVAVFAATMEFPCLNILVCKQVT